MPAIIELIRIAGTAASALIVCSPMLLASRPRTPLRVFCIAVFEYFARLRGCALGRDRRIAIAHACDFGSLRDEFYDDQKLNRTEYKSLRSALRCLAPESATSRYIQQLRKAERGRPILSATTPDLATATINYRASVIDISLQWMQAISGLPLDPAKSHSLLNLVCLMQLADDVLDWKDDQVAQCPSYVTALLLKQPPAAIAPPLRAQAYAMLQHTVDAARQDASAIPFALAGVVTWAFVVILLKVRFPQ